MNIELIVMSLEELELVRRTTSCATLRGMAILPGALPPDFVLDIALQRTSAGDPWFWCAPRLFCSVTDCQIVGSASFKNAPAAGSVEIGYGVAESSRGRNIATQAVQLLVAEAFRHHEVTAIDAETAFANVASQRVLEKTSFQRTGWRLDPSDGILITWRRGRSA